MTDGATYHAALEIAEQAIGAWIDTAHSLDRTIPTPRGRRPYA